jgi:phosphomannomutase
MTRQTVIAPTEFVCPSEHYPISRAVHLARLATGFVRCQECPLRDEAGARPPGVLPTGLRRLLTPEGLRGVYRNELGGPLAERLATALATTLWEDADGRRLRAGLAVVVGYDDRPWSAPLAAAVGAALRRSGCETIDVGPVSGPEFRFAIAHLDADAGILATGAGGGPAVAGLDFARGHGRPLSAGGGLDRIAEHAERPTARLARCGGGRREFVISGAYESAVLRHFCTPKSVSAIVASSSGLLLARAGRLASSIQGGLAPLPLPRRGGSTPDDAALGLVGDAVRRKRADLGLWIHEDGSALRVVDETGTAISVASLAGLLLSDALEEDPRAMLATDWPTAEQLKPTILRGQQLVRGNGTAEAMFVSMRDHEAAAGADATGRFWLSDPAPAFDALPALARILRIISAAGAPLSRLISATSIAA